MQAIVLLSVLSLALGADWCYKDSSCGPDSSAWGGACKAGKAQSPINIEFRRYTDGNTYDLYFNSVYKQTRVFNITNNGHSVKVGLAGSTDRPGYVQGTLLQGRRYIWQELHFHWGSEDNVGSEHTVNGKSYALEAHFVHYNADYSDFATAVASNDSNALAVIGVLFSVGRQNNSALAPLIAALPKVATSGTTVQSSSMNLNSIYPTRYRQAGGSFGNVLQYNGSLTTPNCNEEVFWTVLADPSSLSASQIQAFRKVLDSHSQPLVDNYRPVLPVNGRSIRATAAGFY